VLCSNHIVASNLQLYLFECSKIRWYVVPAVIQTISVILLIRLKRSEVPELYVRSAVARLSQRIKISSK